MLNPRGSGPAHGSCAAQSLIVAVVGLATISLCSADPQSPALREAIRGRGIIATARFDYVERFLPGDAPVCRFVTWRGAGSDYIQVDHGDEDGVVSKIRGRPDDPIRQPDFSLVTEGQSWRRNEAATEVAVVPWEEWRLPDLRTLGIDPTGSKDLQFEERVVKTGATVAYREEKDGDLWRVTADASDGKSQYVWWIDPSRGWNVVRMRAIGEGDVWYEHRITLKRMDGVWFPRRIQRFHGPAEDGNVIYDLEILRAEINRPEHPKRFTPNDIGVEPGMVIANRKTGITDVWDGEKPLDQVEFTSRLARGELQLGPTLARLGKRAEIRGERAEQRRPPAAATAADQVSAATPTVGTQPATPVELAEWERYTVSFIRRYELDAGQSERALAILRDCQESARALVLRRAVLGAPARSQSANDQARTAEQRAAVDRRIEGVFREELVPRLEALLTTAQRQRATTSKPGP